MAEARLDPFPAADFVTGSGLDAPTPPSYAIDVASWCHGVPSEWEATSTGLVGSGSLTPLLSGLASRVDAVAAGSAGIVAVTMVFGDGGDVPAVRVRFAPDADSAELSAAAIGALQNAACGEAITPPPRGRYVVELRVLVGRQES